MGLAERIEIIKSIEEKRNSKIICCINGDRQCRFPIVGMSTQVSGEPHLNLYEHLLKTGKTERIDLVLYTRGGNIDAVWPLVNLIREFCDYFSVLVPFRAHSAGTLICLGANEIVMSKLAELSPIDPTTGNQFNPIDEINNRSRKGISVEDVVSYIDLVKENFGLKKEENLVQAFKNLTDRVEPLALGNVKRVHKLIRRLATELLKLHFDEAEYSKKIDEVVTVLTKDLYSHVHYINRKEAMSIFGKEIVKSCTEDEENLLWSLFKDYVTAMKLNERFNIKEYMGDDLTKELDLASGFIDSADLSHAFVTKNKLTQSSKLPPNVQVQIQPGQVLPLFPGFPVEVKWELISEGWKENDDGQ